jgi:hypothetical protein
LLQLAEVSHCAADVLGHLMKALRASMCNSVSMFGREEAAHQDATGLLHWFVGRFARNLPIQVRMEFSKGASYVLGLADIQALHVLQRHLSTGR